MPSALRIGTLALKVEGGVDVGGAVLAFRIMSLSSRTGRGEPVGESAELDGPFEHVRVALILLDKETVVRVDSGVCFAARRLREKLMGREVEHFIQDDRQVTRTREPKLMSSEKVTLEGGEARWFLPSRSPWSTRKAILRACSA